MKNRIIYFFVVLLFACLASGCGHPKVTGKVTFADDNSPLTVGCVCFESPTHAATGPLSADGTYTLGGEKKGDGLPPGTYKVYITNAAEMDMSTVQVATASGGGTLPKMIKLIDKKYEAPSTSGLSVDVNGTMEYNFTVERPTK